MKLLKKCYAKQGLEKIKKFFRRKNKQKFCKKKKVEKKYCKKNSLRKKCIYKKKKWKKAMEKIKKFYGKNKAS